MAFLYDLVADGVVLASSDGIGTVAFGRIYWSGQIVFPGGVLASTGVVR